MHGVRSATFELILFALLKSLGCSVVVHPDLPNGSTNHPDFLTVTPGWGIRLRGGGLSHGKRHA